MLGDVDGDDDDGDDGDDDDGVRIGGIGVRSEVGSINVKPVAIGSRVSGRTKHSARLPDQMCKRTTSNIGPGFVIMHQFFYITNRHHGAPIQVNVHKPEQTNTSILRVLQ